MAVRRRFSFFLLFLFLFSLFSLLLLQNPKFIVQSTWYQKGYDYLGYQIMSHQHSLKLLPEQDRRVHVFLQNYLTAIDLAKLKAERVKVVTATEAITLAAKEPVEIDDNFLIIVNTPYDYQGKTMAQQLKLLAESTAAAEKLGAKLVIDSSTPDQLRATKQGYAGVLALKEAGIMRMVIFDGGHHLPTLALNPELAVMPVTKAQDGQTYINHPYLRDAISQAAVTEIVRDIKTDTILFEIPRLRAIVKPKSAMGEVARQALLQIGAQKDVVATLGGTAETIYELSGVALGKRTVRAANGTVLMTLVLNGETNPQTITTQIKSRLMALDDFESIKEVKVAIVYGDSTFRALLKQMVDPVALSQAVEALAAEEKMSIKLVNIPYSSWDLYWSKVIGFWQQKKDLIGQIL